MYKLVAGLIRLVCKILLHLEIEGRENIPENGPLIVIFNHCSVLDVVFLPVVLPFEIVGFAAYKHRFNAFLQLGKALGNVIFVRRGEVDRRALRAVLQMLSNGRVLIFAPEGTRSKGTLLRGKPGIAYVALKSKTPLLPIGLQGTRTVFKQLRRFKKPGVIVKIGQLFTLKSSLPSKRVGEILQEVTDNQVMPRIRSLLPPDYHGYYRELEG